MCPSLDYARGTNITSGPVFGEPTTQAIDQLQLAWKGPSKNDVVRAPLLLASQELAQGIDKGQLVFENGEHSLLLLWHFVCHGRSLRRMENTPAQSSSRLQAFGAITMRLIEAIRQNLPIQGNAWPRAGDSEAFPSPSLTATANSRDTAG
jgi:hypothetical protein